MILTEDIGSGDYHIKAYEPGAITVNETTYHQSLIISPSKLITEWPPNSLKELKDDHFKAMLDLRPEIVILGTGIRFTMPPASQLAPLYQNKLGVECMDTGAACRTYTALMSEDRNVVAALLIQ